MRAHNYAVGSGYGHRLKTLAREIPGEAFLPGVKWGQYLGF